VLASKIKPKKNLFAIFVLTGITKLKILCKLHEKYRVLIGLIHNFMKMNRYEN